ncbi:MAG: phospho-N-acetylmuramoyl-pentapeptide-transferase [Deltaproteobacteria bacterium]|nr:MAG: phospho-N-acetylmuramoyl-pentapeptide-transferase [Deltaproteobacteria bacterium]
MIYHLLYPLHTAFGVFNVFRYLTFRTIGATLTALLLSLVIGPWVIRKLKELHIEQWVREDVPRRHISKNGTPTMGGLLIIVTVVVSTLLWANLTNFYIWLVLLTIIAFAAIGFWDDYRKATRRKGISGRTKLLFQFIISLGVATLIFSHRGFDPRLTFPFFKGLRPDLGFFYLPFILFVIVGASNAVNLTDGLDGLAIGPVMITAGTFALIAYLAGHYDFARYLLIPFVRGAGELSVFCGAVVGAGLGFLWFNAYPAQVFMGDVGSLSLGGALGTVAVITKQEFLLALAGGIFVAEALSVIIQVGYYRLKGKRVFKMAPIHHHFELKGWAEPKIIVRFWIISIVLGLLALSTLKLR